jgi:LacI family transcriptional regulator, repressor for deo operon, udp, cdd, tsx, nupC, and nupG
MANQDKITIEDIASEAGVSIATVSRILNQKDNVKQKTRQKVLDAMQALDYHPNFLNGLISSESNIILMSVPELSNPIYSTIIDGAQISAKRQGYHLLVHQSKTFYKTINDYELLLQNHPIAGLILLDSLSDGELLEALNIRCPLVMCSEFCEGSGISYVSVDDYAAGKNATNYLIAIGRKKIALINSTLENKYARHREAGYIDSIQSAGIELNNEWIVHLSDVSFDLVLSSATHILSLDNRPDAFFAVSDVYAAAIIKACKKNGLNVPLDVSVVGFDNTDITLMTDPAITTISQPSFQIGYQASDILIEKINNPGIGNKQILLDTELIVRCST